MLVQNYTNKVKLLKLVTGEEIISYVSKTEDQYTLTRPLMCVLGVDPQNPLQGQVSFCPWLICASSNISVDISLDKVLTILEPDANAKNQYIASVGDIREWFLRK